MANQRKHPDRRLTVAPMMDCTDRYDRAFLRCATKRTLLYTEMVVAEAVIHGNRERLLGFDADEHPLALQLGGSDPGSLAEASRIAEGFGYDEINLNVGCPSNRVKAGRFGACLMAEPDLVACCISAMRKAVGVPVTVKCRIGIDDMDDEETLPSFIAEIAETGCKSFTVHARKAWLQGLSPKENREIPPLRYDVVYAAQQRFPDLEIIINGGIPDLDVALDHLRHVDGVMLGRAAYHTPHVLAEADSRIFGDDSKSVSRRAMVEAYLPYLEQQLGQGVPLHSMTRHMLGLYQGLPGARAWRRHLSTMALKPGAGIRVVEEALAFVEPDQDLAKAG
ncbi:MAG: tRNA dihydrouridine(20/20a) synthase DusA [Rhodospirillaceae bacterium]|nr:tRNA dihydrouridine(20/20a) synthase DusA [Rhodospirillaceae bacterium]|tara:strand:- start:5735 stop:6742 length:1008 start_codon:yes stop_codon:yes gene_type:complete